MDTSSEEGGEAETGAPGNMRGEGRKLAERLDGSVLVVSNRVLLEPEPENRGPEDRII